jgi:hypothetical protein
VLLYPSNHQPQVHSIVNINTNILLGWAELSTYSQQGFAGYFFTKGKSRGDLQPLWATTRYIVGTLAASGDEGVRSRKDILWVYHNPSCQPKNLAEIIVDGAGNVLDGCWLL